MQRACRLISDYLAEDWRIDIEGEERKSDESLRGRQGFFDRQVDDLRIMYAAGVTMLPGSDIPAYGLFPGYALRTELENLVRFVGLSPMEAIESATRLPAEFFGLTDELGTLEVGKLADIVLLDADPLADIANTRRIGGVVANGRYLDRSALRGLLDGLSPTTRGDIDLVQRLKAASE